MINNENTSIWFADPTKLITAAYQFEEYVNFMNNYDGQPLRFQFSNSFPCKPEEYKDDVLIEARQILQLSGNAQLSTSEFASKFKGILDPKDHFNNLVYPNQKTHFHKCLSNEDGSINMNSAQVLFDFFDTNCKLTEEEHISRLIECFKQKYDLISFCCYIKDPSIYAPVSPGVMESALHHIGIDYNLKGQCSYTNYTQFLNILLEIRTMLTEVWPHLCLRLIDVQTFLWVLGCRKNEDGKLNFQQWLDSADSDVHARVEQSVEEFFDSDFAEGPDKKQQRKSNVFSHSAEVSRRTKERANGKCELCGTTPFLDKNNIPYLESHHIIWRSNGGPDNTDNTAALCPNCHRKMHVNPQEEDVKYLESLRAKKN